MPLTLHRLALFSLLFGAGCDGLAGGGYAGEPLATLNGTVQNTQALTSDDELRAYLFWGDPDHGAVAVADAEVDGQFPSEFTLSIYDPPPQETIDANGGWVFGSIRVLPTLDPLEAGDVYGIASAWLLYAEDPEAEGVRSAVNGEVHEGFSLLVLNPTADACHDGGDNDHDRCVAVCDATAEGGECGAACDLAGNQEGATPEEIAAAEAACATCQLEREGCVAACPAWDCPAYHDQVPLDAPVQVDLVAYDPTDV